MWTKIADFCWHLNMLSLLVGKALMRKCEFWGQNYPVVLVSREKYRQHKHNTQTLKVHWPSSSETL